MNSISRWLDKIDKLKMPRELENVGLFDNFLSIFRMNIFFIAGNLLYRWSL